MAWGGDRPPRVGGDRQRPCGPADTAGAAALAQADDRAGSGDPTRAICSTLIAGAFQSIRYPILPRVTEDMVDDPECGQCVREILHVRHSSLFVPADFDLSPYFAVLKPGLDGAFDHHRLRWADAA